MWLAKNNKNIPEYFIHNRTLTNSDGQTVAMIYAKKKKIPPKEWHHDPNI